MDSTSKNNPLVAFREEVMHKKLEALAEHISQVRSIDFADAISTLNRYKEFLCVDLPMLNVFVVSLLSEKTLAFLISLCYHPLSETL